MTVVGVATCSNTVASCHDWKTLKLRFKNRSEQCWLEGCTFMLVKESFFSIILTLKYCVFPK